MTYTFGSTNLGVACDFLYSCAACMIAPTSELSLLVLGFDTLTAAGRIKLFFRGGGGGGGAAFFFLFFFGSCSLTSVAVELDAAFMTTYSMYVTRHVTTTENRFLLARAS